MPDFKGTEYIFRYPLKDDLTQSEYEHGEKYQIFASACFNLTENSHKIFAPLNDTRALDAFTKFATVKTILDDKTLCTNWTYRPYHYSGGAPVPLAWNMFGPTFTPPASLWDGSSADKAANLITLKRFGSMFKYSAEKSSVEMYYMCEYFALPNSSASDTYLCSQATSVASWDGGPTVNQSYCVHRPKRKPDDDYKSDYSGYTLFCERGGGRPAQAESVEKRMKLWIFVNQTVLPSDWVPDEKHLLLALMFDTGMTNWRYQSFCIPGTPCRSSFNKEILSQDKTKGLVVTYKWQHSFPKEVKAEEYDKDCPVLCTGTACR
uniref:GON domain-containing protein n=1 Tax=Macrostomum lignano TaxID=282301 RepID=A0A1I8HEB2_9PLAT